MAIVADVTCNGSIEIWLPLYPDAEVVSVQHNFIRPRALGSSLMILRTDATADQIEDFYRQNIDTLINQGTPRGMGSTDFQVEPDQDSGGSLILLFTRCIL